MSPSPLDSILTFVRVKKLSPSVDVIVSDIAIFVLKRDVKLQLTLTLLSRRDLMTLWRTRADIIRTVLAQQR